MEKTNKELVVAGHELAKTLSADTPLIEIAKFVSELATRLDVQVVLAKQLAAENAQASEIMTRTSMLKLEATAEGLFDAVAASNNPALIAAVNSLSGAVNATPELEATEAWLNEVRAQGIHFAVNRMLAAWESGFVNDTPAQAYDISGGFLTALEFLPNASPDEFKRDYADEVRSAIAARLRTGEKL